MKKVILLTDELDKPIRVVELKEYRTFAELEEVIKVCKENEALMNERNKAKENAYVEKISLLEGKIAETNREIAYLKSQIALLLGEDE